MHDSFDRKIDYLRISVTDRCNLRCRYCMPEEGVPALRHRDILSYEELLRVARVAVAAGVRKIRITGGEPLVRKGIVDFIAGLARLPRAPEITLTTNGLLLAEQAVSLKKAGLSRINVSLDSLDAARYRQVTRRDGLAQVLEGLEAAVAVGLTPLKINMVPILGVNEDEIAAFGRLTIERPWQVRFIEFMPISSDLDYSSGQLYSAARIKADLQQLAPLQKVPQKGILGPARIYRLQGAVGTLGIISAVTESFCRECNRLRLTADGQLRPCLLSQNEIDLRTLLRAGIDDKVLAKLLQTSVTAKPERHCGGIGCGIGQRRMQEIGG